MNRQILAAQVRSLVLFYSNSYPVVDKENTNGRGGGGGSMKHFSGSQDVRFN